MAKTKRQAGRKVEGGETGEVAWSQVMLALLSSKDFGFYSQ